ncbi:MAG: bifunctional 4-hydroxy-2-oxoglutarate aldolase/2-dehydro-3-deoxy-phosphogluconate aldolase [Rhodocyclaceae bacterium]|nr:bifunctional 4-hydroxy-2-oxoglutarate aldolase/2-dehydro-3-deoxy-phosphogluconate aldolase [Rhodocyclaceae bacterium]
MTANRSTQIRELIGRTAVIPVLAIDDVAHAVPLARALCDGGLKLLEITLRTPAALPSIAAIAAALPEVVVGAGTVRSASDAARASEAGARFAVSPGYTAALGNACVNLGLPCLPGVATASEVMAAFDDGYDVMKFFPAETAGGLSMLNALAGPFPDVAFCPTGGINAKNALAYLARTNVLCVGGSWLAPRAEVADRNWAKVTELAADAARLKRSG